MLLKYFCSLPPHPSLFIFGLYMQRILCSVCIYTVSFFFFSKCVRCKGILDCVQGGGCRYTGASIKLKNNIIVYNQYYHLLVHSQSVLCLVIGARRFLVSHLVINTTFAQLCVPCFLVIAFKFVQQNAIRLCPRDVRAI